MTKLAEGQGSEQTLMSIAGHMSRKMLEHYSHIRVAAKRTALEGIVGKDSAEAVAQNWAQPPTSGKTTFANSQETLVGLGGLEPPTSPLSVVNRGSTMVCDNVIQAAIYAASRALRRFNNCYRLLPVLIEV
jgi:hypothetical protein